MNLPNFDPAEHSLFRVHTHVTAQGFIFVNFDSSPTPLISFTDQFGDDFDPNPTSATGKIIGDEYALLEPPSEWAYDHTFESAPSGTAFNWKTFVDGFSECYHCGPAHPTTLGKDFDLKAFYLRLGFGAGRGYLPPLRQDLGLSEAVITSLYPLGSIIFSDKMLLIARWDARGACDTSYQNETYRRVGMQKGSVEYEKWMAEDGDVGYSRIVEREDVVLAMAAQKGFNNGVLGKGRLHPKEGMFSAFREG
jgi:phenylpropionate dioxygenase-like ring-hydroxylating dioxygenase large terminal subunit